MCCTCAIEKRELKGRVGYKFHGSKIARESIESIFISPHEFKIDLYPSFIKLWNIKFQTI